MMRESTAYELAARGYMPIARGGAKGSVEFDPATQRCSVRRLHMFQQESHHVALPVLRSKRQSLFCAARPGQAELGRQKQLLGYVSRKRCKQHGTRAAL